MRVIVELGRVLGLTVAAEGVETEGQLALLRELGVDVAQGNLMAAAEPRRRSSITCACRPRSRRPEPQVRVYSGPEPPSGGVRRPPLAVIAPHWTQLDGVTSSSTRPSSPSAPTS